MSTRHLLRNLVIVAAIGIAATPKLVPLLTARVEPWMAGWLHATGPEPEAPGVQAAAPREAAATSVTAVVAEPGPLAEVVSSTGTLLADEAVALQAEVGGRIVAIAFDEGTRVAAGTLLVKLNDAELVAMRAAAERELELATQRAERAAELLAQNFVRRDEYDLAENERDVRAAELALIDARIAKTEIRAPFTGTTGLRHVSEGAIVTASTEIATLQRTDTLKIEFALPERYAGRIGLGTPIDFSVAGHDQRFAGEVYAYDPHIDTETRTLLLRARCSNPEGLLLPGAFANVRVTLAETADALLVPAYALIPDLEAAYVYVVADGRAERRRVDVGVRTEDRVQILSGLAPGDVVVTSGLQQLRPGAPVRVTLAPALSAAAGERPRL